MPGRRRKQKLKRCGRLFANRSLVRLWWQDAEPGDRSEYILHVIAVTIGLWIVGGLFVGMFSTMFDPSNMSIWLFYWIPAQSTVFWFGGTILPHLFAWSFLIGFPISAALSNLDYRLSKYARKHLNAGPTGRSDVCFQCGYDLFHTHAYRCPECGARAASHLAELRR